MYFDCVFVFISVFKTKNLLRKMKFDQFYSKINAWLVMVNFVMDYVRYE